MKSHPKFSMKACLNKDSHLVRAQVKVSKLMDHVCTNKLTMPQTIHLHPDQLGENSLSPYKPTLFLLHKESLSKLSADSGLSLLSCDQAFFWDVFIQLRLKLRLVIVPAPEEDRSLLFFLPSTKPQKPEVFSRK